MSEKQRQIPTRLRSGQAFDSPLASLRVTRMIICFGFEFGGRLALGASKASLLPGGYLPVPLREMVFDAPLRALLVMVTVPL